VFEEQDRLRKSSSADLKARHYQENSYDSEDVLYSSTKSSNDQLDNEEETPKGGENSVTQRVNQNGSDEDKGLELEEKVTSSEKTDDVREVGLDGPDNADDKDIADSNGTSTVASSSSSVVDVSASRKRPPLTIDIPETPPTCDEVRGDVAAGETGESYRLSPSEVLSPRSCSIFRNNLLHVPEMNLPWTPLRTSSKCACGVAFSYSTRKVSLIKLAYIHPLMYACVCAIELRLLE